MLGGLELEPRGTDFLSFLPPPNFGFAAVEVLPMALFGVVPDYGVDSEAAHVVSDYDPRVPTDHSATIQLQLVCA